MRLKLNEKEIRQVFRWFEMMAHEIDISEDDYKLFKRIEQQLPADYRGSIEMVHKQYNEQFAHT